ncbi:MAG: type III-B CRISPR-associated protein Cas10/Cmr2 [Candidatus Cloacimonetes bacterium]|nr:type III-B CRISPR-associated protein Cas10/Cmr2 [Candidatus Cloacimonadota bacterium]
MRNKYLFLFTISPVQSFISQARKTRDLRAGSQILSDLIKFALDSIKLNNPQIIFPVADSESKPNRFITEIEFENAEEVYDFGNELSDRVKNKFIILAGEVFRKESKNQSFPKHFESQINNFLDVYWVAKPLGSDYQTAYSEIERSLASVKNIKTFKQTYEQGRKCSICGERNAIFPSREKLESLCGICFTKRHYKKGSSKFPSTADIALQGSFDRIISNIKDEETKARLLQIKENYPELLLTGDLEKVDWSNIEISGLDKLDIIKLLKSFMKTAKENNLKLSSYYAILIFDGDKMGEWLSGIKLPDSIRLREFHENFSVKLGEYALNASKYLDSQNRGKTIYAGGDDFLGFLNLLSLLDTIKALREMFDKEVNQHLKNKFNFKENITFSAGISIAHIKTPLRIVLQSARAMEKQAKDKEQGNRDALAIAIIKHSGERLETYLKWTESESNNIGIISDIIIQLTNDNFSSTFIKAIQEEFGLKLTADEVGRGAYDNELKRLIGRSCNRKKDEKKRLISDLTNKTLKLLANCEYNQDRFYGLLNIIDFLIRETLIKKGKEQ